MMAAFPAVRILLLPVSRDIRAVPCKKSIIFLGRRHEETAHPRRRAMGVGKSAVCRELLRQLTPGVWLDGDWCWNMNPFVVSEENKRMVLSNITHLLRATSGQFELPLRAVLLGHGSAPPFRGRARARFGISPLRRTAFHSSARSRLCGNGWNAMYGTASGRLTSSRELRRLPAYAALPTCKLDVTSLTPYEAACAIAASVGRASSRGAPDLSGAGES